MKTSFRRLVWMTSLSLLGCSSEAPDPKTIADAPSVTVPAAPPERGTADSTLIPRQDFFGNPDRVAARLSPDGKRVAFLAPENGVMNVFVGPAEAPSKAQPLTAEKTRGLRSYFFTYDNRGIVYLQDTAGDENFHLHYVDFESKQSRDLSPYPNTRAQLAGLSQRHPGKLLIGMNDRDPKFHDVYEVELATGKRKLLFKNEHGYQVVADEDLVPRFATLMKADATVDWFSLDKAGKTRPIATIPQADVLTTDPLHFDAKGKTLYLLDSRGRDKSALVAFDPQTGKQQVLHEAKLADVQAVLAHPKNQTPQAVAETHARREWTVLDKSLDADFELLKKTDGGDLDIAGRSTDDKRWLVSFSRADGATRSYLYDRDAKKTTFLFSSQPSLDKLGLLPMFPLSIPARDGLPLTSYLTLPKAGDPNADGVADQPAPLVLLVHGGPWARDNWGYNPYHQWLASRGYAVLSVNYRGSTGFGKAFVNAADREWAGKMHDDLLDSVQYAIDKGITNKDQVAIFGGSYGGYSTLVGLTFTPQTFACGVDLVGPSNLVTLLENIPPYWAPFRPLLTSKLADPTSPEGKAWLLSRSPISKVERIERPLLIGQGKNDPRVKQLESDQIVKAMQDRKIPVTYVLYPDEGHGFVRPENRKSFNAVAELFLARCLNGRYEPIGSDFAGSSIEVPAGAEQLPGLADALLSKQK